MLFLQSINSLTYTSLCGIHEISHSSLTSRIIASVALSTPSSPPPGSVHHSSPVWGCLWCTKRSAQTSLSCFYSDHGTRNRIAFDLATISSLSFKIEHSAWIIFLPCFTIWASANKNAPVAGFKKDTFKSTVTAF